MLKMGKLVTPANITNSTRLNSWLILTKLNANVNFFDMPAKNWPKEQSYMSLKAALKDMQEICFIPNHSRTS